MRSIPAEFECMGYTIKVKFSPTLVEDEGAYGVSYFNQSLIVLQEPGKMYSRSLIIQTFLHEATHMILDAMGYSKLSGDEKFVDQLGHCIYQMLKTKRGKCS